EHYNSASPYLIVNGAQATMDFLVAVFGAERLRSYTREDGTIAHAEVRIDDSVVMLADPVEGWPAIAANVHIYVADVDTTYKRGIDAGATPVQEPVRKDDEDKRGGFRDAGG